MWSFGCVLVELFTGNYILQSLFDSVGEKFVGPFFDRAVFWPSHKPSQNMVHPNRLSHFWLGQFWLPAQFWAYLQHFYFLNICYFMLKYIFFYWKGYPLFPADNEAELLAMIIEIINVPPCHILANASRRKLFFDSKNTPRDLNKKYFKKRLPGSKSLGQVLKTVEKSFIDFVSRCLE